MATSTCVLCCISSAHNDLIFSPSGTADGRYTSGPTCLGERSSVPNLTPTATTSTTSMVEHLWRPSLPGSSQYVRLHIPIIDVSQSVMPPALWERLLEQKCDIFLTPPRKIMLRQPHTVAIPLRRLALRQAVGAAHRTPRPNRHRANHLLERCASRHPSAHARPSPP